MNDKEKKKTLDQIRYEEEKARINKYKYKSDNPLNKLSLTEAERLKQIK